MRSIIAFIFINIFTISSYASIPLPGAPGMAFSKGINQGRAWGNNIQATIQAQEAIRLQKQEKAIRQLQMEIMREQLRQLKKEGKK